MRLISKLAAIGLIWNFMLFLPAGCNKTTKQSNVDVQIRALPTSSNASLRGLFVFDENVIWASGTGGKVLNSKDGGKNWNIIQVPGAEKNDFRSIHAWDENSVMVFGIAGPDFGFYTNDGGISWGTVFQDTTKGLFFDSLKFADEKNGLAVSDPINGKLFVIRTEDAGLNWEIVCDIPEVVEGEANFAASNTCIEFLPSGKAWIATGGKAARVFYSVDFGKSWDVAKTPMISGGTSTGIFSVSFKNDMEGVIVGGTYDKPEFNENIAAFTSDGGKTWQPAEKMPAAYRSCVQFVSSQKNKFFLAIGKTGCDVSTDNGKNWQFIAENGFYIFRAIPGKTAGFAAGNDGRISRFNFTE